jgi:hypothetical protein
MIVSKAPRAADTLPELEKEQETDLADVAIGVLEGPHDRVHDELEVRLRDHEERCEEVRERPESKREREREERGLIRIDRKKRRTERQRARSRVTEIFQLHYDISIKRNRSETHLRSSTG